jgi:hypothetical protein
LAISRAPARGARSRWRAPRPSADRSGGRASGQGCRLRKGRRARIVSRSEGCLKTANRDAHCRSFLAAGSISSCSLEGAGSVLERFERKKGRATRTHPAKDPRRARYRHVARRDAEDGAVNVRVDLEVVLERVEIAPADEVVAHPLLSTRVGILQEDRPRKTSLARARWAIWVG